MAELRHVDPARNSVPNINLQKGIPESVIAAGQTFLGDAQLVLPGITVTQSSDMPPANFGEYSLQVITPDTDMEKIKKAKILVVGCMDKRQAQALYENAKLLGDTNEINPDEIVMITIASGIVQTEHGRRDEALATMIDFVIDNAPDLQTIVLSAHTSDPKNPDSKPCGGITYLNGGRHIADALSQADKERLKEDYQLLDATDENLPHEESNPSKHQYELAATAEVASRHAADTLKKHKNHPILKPIIWIIVPNDKPNRPEDAIRQIYAEIFNPKEDENPKSLQELFPHTVRRN